MDILKQALEKAIGDAKNNGGHLNPRIPVSRVKQISVSSVINRRRRQEDRWFFASDLVAYAPIGDVSTSHCPLS